MGEKHDKPLHLEMSFEEALERFAQVDVADGPPGKQPAKARKKRLAPESPPQPSNQNGETPR
jgi:hypothetical protein